MNPLETRLVAVCNDNDLKLYSIRSKDEIESQQVRSLPGFLLVAPVPAKSTC